MFDNQNLIFRKAEIKDLPKIIVMLKEDELGEQRESENIANYQKAFLQIDADQNQFLLVAEKEQEVIATAHLTKMPSLTFGGSLRLQIEAVRVVEKYRGQKMGQQMMSWILDFAKKENAKIIQLTTNKKRTAAKRFYEKIGFEATHEGMKLYL